MPKGFPAAFRLLEIKINGAAVCGFCTVKIYFIFVSISARGSNLCFCHCWTRAYFPTALHLLCSLKMQCTI